MQFACSSSDLRLKKLKYMTVKTKKLLAKNRFCTYIKFNFWKFIMSYKRFKKNSCDIPRRLLTVWRIINTPTPNQNSYNAPRCPERGWETSARPSSQQESVGLGIGRASSETFAVESRAARRSAACHAPSVNTRQWCAQHCFQQQRQRQPPVEPHPWQLTGGITWRVGRCNSVRRGQQLLLKHYWIPRVIVVVLLATNLQPNVFNLSSQGEQIPIIST